MNKQQLNRIFTLNLIHLDEKRIENTMKILKAEHEVRRDKAVEEQINKRRSIGR